MRQPVRTLATLGLAALLGSLLTVSAPAATARPAAQPPVGSGPPRTVTLITGDRVEVVPGAPPRVIPAEGRTSIRFRVSTGGGRIQVLPLDAVGLVAAGKLDPRLFDVTTLLEFGYDDARRSQLPLIVQRAASGRSAGPALRGASARRELRSIGGYSVLESKKDSVAFWTSLVAGTRALAPGVTKVWLNGLRRTTLDHTVPQIGVPAAWSAGLTGRGVTVAVVDTGIDAQHPDLAGKVAAAKTFVDGATGDQIGHGTHVASTVTGSGAASGGSYRGVAPDVRLIDAKVCGEQGCPEDAILAGMEWAAVEQDAAVVNLSLGGADAPGDDPIEQAVNTLSAQHGTLFVISAGNSGVAGAGTVGSPGSAAAALTVGAVDKRNALAPFSSRGPTVGNALVKPDVTAPGVDVVAAKAAGTEAGTPVGEQYVSLSGTSMAAPHVAGAAAILLQQHPEWTGAQVKAALMASARPAPGSAGFDQGAGRVDVAQGITQQVVASPPSLSFGLASWPHEDDPVQEKAITYRNSADTAVTLDLVIRVENQPAGLFTVSPSRIVVPAGGTATATVATDTRSAGVPIGRFSGQLVASGHGTTVSTPIGVEKEPERYDVDLTTIGRDGKAPLEHVTFFDRLGPCGGDVSCGDYLYGAGTSRSKVRLAPGRYTMGHFSTVTGHDWTLLMHSVMDIEQDGSVVLDARTAKPVEMSAPRATARLMDLQVTLARDLQVGPAGIVTYALSGDGDRPLFIAERGTPAPAAEVVSVAYGRFAEPGPAGDFANSPYEYNLADYALGRALNGVRLRPRQEEFAAVKAAYAADTDEPRTARTGHVARPVAATLEYAAPPSDGQELRSRLPFERTEYFLARGLRWSSSMVSQGESGLIEPTWLFSSQRSVYQPGRTYRQQWNKGVFGPRLTTGPIEVNGSARGAQRTGDRLLFGLSLRSDSNPLHMNHPKLPAGSAKLYRDGELVQDWPYAAFVAADVPPGEASYRLETRVAVEGTEVSPTIDTAWTFRSGHVEGVAALPFMAVHFRPQLDNFNRARAGSGFTIPISVQRQPGAPAVPVKALTVEASTDDGTTWRPVKVERAGAGWRTKVTNEPGAAVSLRASATDADGNKVEQTVLRGYRVRN
ncbi:peptidase S8 and S53 subtilisin kexin sedolisin [Kribbella flavida DSM 17836]|uniref:Peptidase S8 and S53 subtilisin kexin sedolisin n=1 Tax=Kribbella flavida (strain DSM 17836 / JCM 10339 / NBRC 14399) TaxID=479435 RepID=D2PQS9_KRIFD|nr:S8 family serine peptidase [Kribbella flavida]ADB31062.1 peptidase S8 and S53 subtilisin kexin sedolisin [Kribbella flavida DSM 17836]